MRKGFFRLMVIAFAVLFVVVSIQPALAGSHSKAEGKATMEKAVMAKKININTADAQALSNLKGIGPELAQRILDYRSKSGKFKNIEEVKNVKGIGDKIYSQIAPLITVK